MPRLASPAQAFREVFISGTKVDLEPYRLAIRHALQEARIGVFLFEYDAGPAFRVVDRSLDRIRSVSDAYFGIYGYRYGWVPEDRLEGKSITHLEYETACERWFLRERHRLFLFRPEPGSEAADELKRLANDALARDYPGEDLSVDVSASRQASRDRQADFLKTISAAGVLVNIFGSRDDLMRRAPLAVRNGEGYIDRRAPPTRGRPAAVAGDADFGAVGRDKHLDTLNDARQALQQRAECPAICVVVHGAIDMGHRSFGDCLLRWPAWEGAREHLRLAPPEDRTDAAWLRNAMTTGLAPGSAAPATDFATLASVIADRCAIDQTVVLLDHVERIRDGLTGFFDSVWLPLHSALCDRCATRSFRHRFALVVMLRSPLPDSLPPFVWSGRVTAPQLDYSRLVALPKLGKLKQSDVRNYLRNVLGNWTIGDPDIHRLTGDGIPAHVYGRLVDEDLVGRGRGD